jgi:hypothetical protein
MAEHRANSLSTLLPTALSTGLAETEFQLGPLRVPYFIDSNVWNSDADQVSQDFDTDLILESNDTATRFAISSEQPIPPGNVETHITALLESWNPTAPRQFIPDSDWVAELTSYINGLVDLRISHVRSWLNRNLGRFEGDHEAIEDLRRKLDNMVIELRTNVQLCGALCASCNLICIRSRLHEGKHGCSTDHKCTHTCGFCVADPGLCGIRYDVLCLSVVVTEKGIAPDMLGSTRT